jgi:hypothetical protein
VAGRATVGLLYSTPRGASELGRDALADLLPAMAALALAAS